MMHNNDSIFRSYDIFNIIDRCSQRNSESNEDECKIADLCVHDKVPMCAIDSCGEMRTFIDICDMHEFNCDSKKDFKQRPIHECWVTCKRGRSFKRAEFNDCSKNTKTRTVNLAQT
ncbi:unnamed protein product [Spodoptera littoralis]|uniref:Kazal-like domain-containing protein n=1 Tax=Spodoptera littoralis TaxID=7109 RepID=A0A9P0HV87_SPOLI|nr:unnamed protein product [Spodoptera littoralis]CAH1635980.1 unnamed protein product [Spodoptera littoralis]